MELVSCCVTHPVIPALYPDYDCGACCATISPSDTPQCSICDSCSDCCGCYHCGACDKSVNPSEYSQCSTCDSCADCCDCWHCSDCEENICASDSACESCGHCESCCDNRGYCWTCRNCHNRYGEDSYQCSNCNSCEDSCCDCSSCGHCGHRFSAGNVCGECDRCSDCGCDCNSDGDNSEVLTRGELTFHTATKLQHKRNKSRRHISLEIEVAGDDGSGAENVRPEAEHWLDSIVEDGSLPDSGYEINTNPSSGDLFLDHIKDICKGLNYADARVDSSCGMHCHVDARDYNYFDLFKLCKLYAGIEDALFSIVSRSRRGGRYSETCGARYTFSHYATFKTDLTRALYGECALSIHPSYDGKTKKPNTRHHRGKNVLSDKAERYNSARYFALNLHSFFYRGTIEFRHHQGCTRATRAANWGMVCAAIVDAASRLTVAEIDALPTSSFDKLIAILPTAELREYAAARRAELV